MISETDVLATVKENEPELLHPSFGRHYYTFRIASTYQAQHVQDRITARRKIEWQLLQNSVRDVTLDKSEVISSPKGATTLAESNKELTSAVTGEDAHIVEIETNKEGKSDNISDVDASDDTEDSGLLDATNAKAIKYSSMKNPPFRLTRFYPDGYIGEVPVLHSAWKELETISLCSECKDEPDISSTKERDVPDGDKNSATVKSAVSVPYLIAPPTPERAQPKSNRGALNTTDKKGMGAAKDVDSKPMNGAEDKGGYEEQKSGWGTK